jgi:glycosyltransferase involved in cell wall biosynthesis
VTLVIPAWNEAEAIGPVLDEVPPGVVDEVVVVVGGEDDPTAEVARRHGARVVAQAEPGYGAACWTGARAAMAANARVVAFLDGDYADPPAALPRLLAPIAAGRADLVLGRRDLRRYPAALPLHARLGNRLVLLLLRVLVRSRSFGDLPSFKAIRADALRRLDLREMTYGWTVELLIKAARLRLRIEEVEVEYRPRLGGRSKVAGSLRGSVAAGWTLLACALGSALPRPLGGALSRGEGAVSSADVRAPTPPSPALRAASPRGRGK